MFKRKSNTTSDGNVPRVVILGGGYGGLYAALELQKAAKRGEVELTLISWDNFFLFQPLLAEVISGGIEPLHVVSPIRRLIPSANFLQAEVEEIHPDSQDVIIRFPGHPHRDHVPYDQLIIAVGRSTDLSALPGVAEHALPFKTLGDAFTLRNHLIRMMEAAEVEEDAAKKREMLTFVVAGGGITGVEVVAEINDFVKEASKYYPHVITEEVRVILLHGNSRILPELNEKLANFSHRLLERRGIEIRLNIRINGATAETAMLSDGSTIAIRTMVAAVGSSPNRLLDSIPSERDRRGGLIVDETLAVPGQKRIWAVGDVASVPDVLEGGTAPPTAQYALREAKQAAKNILATIRGNSPRRFAYRNRGVFVPLGRYSAVAEAFGLKLSGFLAWWLYRTYYLFQIPRLERKLRIVTDWTLDLVFPGDIVYTDIIGSRGITRAHYEAGTTVYRQGDLSRNFSTILSGEVEVVREQDGLEKRVAVLGIGEHFGEVSLLQGDRHTASVRALTPIDVLVMSGADFTALANSSSHFGELLDEVMRKRLAASSTDGSKHQATN